MKYIVAKIHNNSLGRVVEAKDEKEAIAILIEWAESQYQRKLTDEEMEDVANNLELFNEDDADNIFCFSIGIVEENNVLVG